MTGFDFVVLAILVVSGVLGLVRGLLKEVLSLVAYLLAFVAAIWWGPTLSLIHICESIPDVGAIAWPVTLSGEHYAISVGGPIYRIEPCQEEYARILRAACTGLEQQS